MDILDIYETGFHGAFSQVLELQRPGWRQRATPEPEELPVTVEDPGNGIAIEHCPVEIVDDYPLNRVDLSSSFLYVYQVG